MILKMCDKIIKKEKEKHKNNVYRRFIRIKKEIKRNKKK